MVYSKDGLTESAVRNWAILRSHESLSDTVNIIRGLPLIGSQYNAHNSREKDCDALRDVPKVEVVYSRYFAVSFRGHSLDFN